MARTNARVVVVLGILTGAGVVMSAVDLVSPASVALTGLIWLAYMGYWAYEHRVATEE